MDLLESWFKRVKVIGVTMVLSVASNMVAAGMIDKEGLRAWEICALCHSADGVSRMAKFPKLAGQKAHYIEQQFIRFAQGSRQNGGGQMVAITTEVENGDISHIADYFSSLPADSLQVNVEAFDKAEKEWVTRGKQLFYHGKEGVTACAQCHTDKAASAPWIDRQHRDYLKKQLEDFASGERATSVEDVATVVRIKAYNSAAFSHAAVIMGDIAKRLSAADINALSFYLSVTSIVRD
ncbi:MAG: cytochrome c553 [Candidatus Endobugula sp.]|jgi:cytochrome c553